MRLWMVMLALGTSTVAQAKEPFMWGAGPRLGTMVLPGSYPFNFPPAINKYDMDGDGETDLDADGNPMETSLARVRGDVILGGTGTYYIDKDQRIGGHAGFGFGKQYFDVHGIVMYHRVAARDTVDFLYGGGAGVGWQRFNGDVGAEKLALPYYPLRVEGIGQVRDKTRAYAVTLWGQFNIPARHYYTNQAGNPIDLGSPLNYLSMGLDASVMFGDFTPPKKKKKKKGGGGGGGGKSSGGTRSGGSR